MLNARDFGAVGNGITDDTDALQLAINTAYDEKTGLLIPGGDYLTGTLNMPFDGASTYSRGNYIEGDGMMNTRLIAKQAGTIVFSQVQPVSLKFQMGGHIAGMSILGNGLANTQAIRSQAAFSFGIYDVIAQDFAIGWNVVNQGNPGDYDACNHIVLENSRILNCSQWGIKTDLRTGNNETSFMGIRNSTIENCGTLAGAIGGGMYWRGQMLQFDNSAFVLCKNRGLYIEGGAGLGSNVLGNSLCFENNQGISIQCYGITGMEFNQLQIYNNDANIAQYGMYLSAQSYMGQVRINSAKIRATAANSPYTAFLATGANIDAGTLVIDTKQVRWDTPLYAGQTKYSSGWTLV